MNQEQSSAKHLRSKQLIATGVMLLLMYSIARQHALAQKSDSPAYDRMYVFGDSYSDIGEGYLDGNGPTAVAYLAERLGFKLWPSNTADPRGKSLDYAVSGAQSGAGVGTTLKGARLAYGMKNQVQDFAAKVRSHAIEFEPTTTLFFIAGGLNDGKAPDGTTVTNEKEEIRELYELGGRRFVVALLPAAIPPFSALARRVNPELATIPDEMEGELKGADIRLSHWGMFFDDVLLQPQLYGIANTTDACAGRAISDEDTTPCATPDKYFYYHANHPSTAVHKIVGDKLYAEITGSIGQTSK